MIRRCLTRFIAWETAQVIFLAGGITGALLTASLVIAIMAGHAAFVIMLSRAGL